MSLLQQCVPGLEALTTRWDMRGPPDNVPIMPGVHTVSLSGSVGVCTTSIRAIFPGVRSLAINPADGDSYTLTPDHPSPRAIKSPCLDTLRSGGVAGLSQLHPRYMRATLLDIRGCAEFRTSLESWTERWGESARDSAALPNLLVRVRPELLRLNLTFSMPHCVQNFIWTMKAAHNVVVMQLDLQHTYGATKIPEDIFCWVRFDHSSSSL
jgi:hypothetical protein